MNRSRLELAARRLRIDPIGAVQVYILVTEVTGDTLRQLEASGVTIEIPANQITAVIGPNGAGKTTFFNAVCGFVRPQSGEVSYRGRPLTGIHPHQLTGLGISRTLQGLGLWRGLTVAENVMVGARRQGRPGFGAPSGGRRAPGVERRPAGRLSPRRRAR